MLIIILRQRKKLESKSMTGGAITIPTQEFLDIPKSSTGKPKYSRPRNTSFNSINKAVTLADRNYNFILIPIEIILEDILEPIKTIIIIGSSEKYCIRV